MHEDTAAQDAAHTIQGYSARQTADIVGITYRQLDYWARTDLVSALPGPGHRQRKPPPVQLRRSSSG